MKKKIQPLSKAGYKKVARSFINSYMDHFSLFLDHFPDENLVLFKKIDPKLLKSSLEEELLNSNFYKNAIKDGADYLIEMVEELNEDLLYEEERNKSDVENRKILNKISANLSQKEKSFLKKNYGISLK